MCQGPLRLASVACSPVGPVHSAASATDVLPSPNLTLFYQNVLKKKKKKTLQSSPAASPFFRIRPCDSDPAAWTGPSGVQEARGWALALPPDRRADRQPGRTAVSL